MKIGVLGAGVMGSGIAQVCALAGDDVVCYDIDADGARPTARAHVTTGRFGLDGAVARGKVDARRGRRRARRASRSRRRSKPRPRPIS